MGRDTGEPMDDQIDELSALEIGDAPLVSAPADGMQIGMQSGVQTRYQSRSQRNSWRFSLYAYPATYLLMGINIAVFAVMFFSGPLPALIRHHDWSRLLLAPYSGQTLERFGGTSSYLIQSGQWWRLVTGTFVHVTVLHITLNLWCLWNLGLFGEPLLGKRGLVAVYLLTGSAGMLVSYAWSVLTGQGVLVVGASGAVFGIAGILIVLLSNRRLAVPWDDLRSLRGQVIFFAAANLVLGMTPQVLGMASRNQLRLLHVNLGMLPRIDNTAHLGGFLCGLLLGLPLLPRMTAGRERYRARQRATFGFATLLLSLFGYALSKFSQGW
ncbi:MAG: rhomboid family intramembrane serine protease [Acidobacteriaceae bacterium]